MTKFLKKVLTLIISCILLSVLLVISILWMYSNNLPDYKFLKSYKAPVSSKVYSGNGELVNDFSTEKRIFVPYKAIPGKIINSFLSAEDKNFFSHPGVDAKGVVRAILNNISNILYSKRLEGASTITQQVAKNFLLSNEVSINRKIKEAILAFRIERALSKERILELYLNQIYLGQGTYGVAAASLEYFDKPITELTYIESALLAALPKAPSRYNPYKNKKLAKFRRDLVLKNLLENSYISQTQFNSFIKEEIKLKKRKKIFLEDTLYFVEDVRKNILGKFGFDKVYKDGFNIKTPLDLNLQKIATQSLRNGLIKYDKRRGYRGPLINKKYSEKWFNNLEKYRLEKTIDWKLAIVKKVNNSFIEIETIDKNKGSIYQNDIAWTKKLIDEIFKVGDVIFVKRKNKNNFSLRQLPKANGAVVVMDPYTGRVLAMSGGFSFRQSEFNRASQALRQPGSAFKPFIYALALENNFNPSTLVLDAPLVLEQGSDLKLWKPENYGKKFYGLSTLRTGIEKSRNLMTVRISQDLGLKKIVNFSKKLNIYDNPSELLSISLGSAETTLLKLSSAYSSFLNGGKLITPILIDRIQDSEGNTILNTENRKCNKCDEISHLGDEYPKIIDDFKQIFSPETAYQITSMLEGTVQRGTGKGLRDLKLDLAGKTGTTNNNTDTWFIGFTSKVLVGVYVGYDNPRSLGKTETGAKTAMPIFKEYIKNSVKKEDARPFKVAENITMMVIDPLTGEKASFGTKKTIIESYKKSDFNEGNLIINKLNNRLKNDNVLKFY